MPKVKIPTPLRQYAGGNAEVEVSVGPNGSIAVKDWKHLSGKRDWDASVRNVFQQVHAIRKPPPSGFPPSVVVRFDLIARQLASAQN